VHWLNTATMTIMLILTVVSGLDYLVSAWRLRKHDNA
jgi:CDP-diacylglycerol--glycerol-3-phosphate 3-phosphatidyltransferase